MDETEVVLLHSRLGILDLDPRSNQPFERGERVISFNGELYNYLELRDDLLCDGVELSTDGDTEVLVEALARWGNGALDRFEGMWAFAMWDEGKRRLTLCRDRFGEKPLYVYESGDGLYFGSETRFLTTLLGRSLEVDVEQLHRYLANGYKSLYKVRKTFHRGVREVPPGCYWETTAGRTSQETRYWSPVYDPDEEMEYEDAVRGVRDRFLEAVGLRLRADVPIAFLLSGGIDSNGLVGAAKRAFDAEVHAFTLVNEDERYDERTMVENVVRESGIEHTMVPISREGFRGRLAELIRYHDAPLLTITSYVQWLLMEQIAARGFRVVMTGVGADELLSGYYDHHNLFLGEMFGTEHYRQAKMAWQGNISEMVRNPFLRNPDLYVEDAGFRGHIFLNSTEFSGCLREEWHEAFGEERYADSLMRNRMLNELRHESVPVILHEDDLNAMFFSLENRAPYLSRPLCEFCYRIPTKHLIRDARTKAPLRDALEGLVPQSILNSRKKVGFNAPIASLLELDEPETRDWLLDDGPLFDVVRRDKIEAMLSSEVLPNSVSKFLFNVVCTKVFLEQRYKATELRSWQTSLQWKTSTTNSSTNSLTLVGNM